MTRIILVRHGQSEANLAHRWAAGATDTKLTALGKKQAELLADYLTAHERIDAIYASPLSRATDTVRPTAERLGLSVIPEVLRKNGEEAALSPMMQNRYKCGKTALHGWRKTVTALPNCRSKTMGCGFLANILILAQSAASSYCPAAARAWYILIISVTTTEVSNATRMIERWLFPNQTMMMGAKAVFGREFKTTR